ncbi:hypothetical protein ABEB36_001441 [Hypothenemus hampei]|uniref:Uncharacterized protein n=1 Tax=Hypothenemus hampei TaxID=57062 RepID=A0ABD1FEK0_HYPHA
MKNCKMIKNQFVKSNMAVQFRVMINSVLFNSYEATLSVTESGVVMSPGPPGLFEGLLENNDLHIPRENIDNVVNINVSSIRLEMSNNHHINIVFGNAASKQTFRRLIRADSDEEDSGVSSGSPSPLIVP